MLQNIRLFRGPSFLLTSDFSIFPDKWYRKLRRYAADPNTLDNSLALLSNSNSDFSIPLCKYSSYPKLLGIDAYILRIHLRHATYRSIGEDIKEPEAVTVAEEKLQLLTQAESFPIELMHFKGNEYKKPYCNSFAVRWTRWPAPFKWPG